MSNPILLIEQTEIIGIALANRNFDKALIKNSIIEAMQEDEFRPIIGDDLFDEIILQASTGSLTTLNAELVNKFKAALSFYIVAVCAPTIMVNITSAGIQVNNTEYSQSGTDKQRADAQVSLLDIAKMQKNLFLRWLQKNKANYPLYVSFLELHSNRNQSSSEIIGGILLGD